MLSMDVALRFSVVVVVAGFITMAASIYEIDRREKSTSDTVTSNISMIEQRVQILSNQIRVLTDQTTRQINTNERQLQSLDSQVQALELRLSQFEHHLPGDR